jgi:hypothetical protein
LNAHLIFEASKYTRDVCALEKENGKHDTGHVGLLRKEDFSAEKEVRHGRSESELSFQKIATVRRATHSQLRD